MSENNLETVKFPLKVSIFRRRKVRRAIVEFCNDRDIHYSTFEDKALFHSWFYVVAIGQLGDLSELVHILDNEI